MDADLQLQKTDASNVGQNLQPHLKRHKFPQRQVSNILISFDGNAVINTKTKSITTNKYKAREK